MPVLDLRRFKEAIVSYGIHLAFVEKMLNSWPVGSRIIPNDEKKLIKALLEPGPQLQWNTWFREEAKIIEKNAVKREVWISTKIKILEKEIMLW